MSLDLNKVEMPVAMQMAKLYKKDTKGKIQQWEIIVDTVNGAFYTISGEVGGKLTTTKPTQCTPKNVGKKNESTALDQAFSESKSKITKKKEDGYTEDIKDVDKAAVFEVMLAKNYDAYKDEIKFPVFSQVKLDGQRCRLSADGMWTRNNKAIVSCPHIWEVGRTLLNHIKIATDLTTLHLDGELYSHTLNDNFNRICELVRRQKCSPEELAVSKEIIQYWIYDLIIPETKFSERTKILESAIKACKSNSIVYVPTDFCKTQEELDMKYSEYMDQGYEGQIVRLDAVYENKRSRHLLKRKEWKTDEWQILNIVEGTGDRAGTAGYMEFRTNQGLPFKSNIKGNREWITGLLRNKEQYIGKKATIKYFNLTPDGIPRFPYVIDIDRESYE